MRVFTDVDARWCERWCFRRESQRHPRDRWRRSAGGPGVHVLRSGCRRLRAVRGLPLGDGERVRTDCAVRHRREVQRCRDEHGAVHDPRRRDATDQSTPLQRNGRRRVVERQRRSRRGPGLDARPQRADARGVRLGRRLRAEGRRRRAQVGRSAAWRCRSLRQPVAPGRQLSRTTSSRRPAKRIRDDAGTMLGGLQPKHVIAIGESQSAGRLVTYIDAVHPLVDVYDGFLVHSRMAEARRCRRLRSRTCPSRRRPHPRRPRRARARVPDRDRRLLQQPELPANRTPTRTGCGRSREPRTTTSTGSASDAPTPATARAPSRCSRRC